nr:class I SAM-dependent methyltransferase [Wenzhouxiangella sp. XN24]
MPADFAGNYDGEIAAFWETQFQGVPEGGKVLDLCTGNGAIALLAAGYFLAQQREASVTAVDAAKISLESMARRHPGREAEIAGVTFIDQSPVETLALPDAEYDLVTSQYGIEYCDWAPAAAQAARLLRPGGRLALVCHAASSDIVATMAQEAGDYEVLASLGLLKGLRRFLAGNLSFSRLRKLLQASRDRLTPAYRATRAPLFAYVMKTLEGLLTMNETQLRARRIELAAFVRQLELGEVRLNDMLRVNRAIHETPEWYRVFEAAGLRLLDSHEILFRGKHRSGHAYRFERPDSD